MKSKSAVQAKLQRSEKFLLVKQAMDSEISSERPLSSGAVAPIIPAGTPWIQATAL